MNIEAVILEVGLLKLEPGQILVVTSRDALPSADLYYNLWEYIQSKLPGVKVLVLPPCDMTVIPKEREFTCPVCEAKTTFGAPRINHAEGCSLGVQP